MRLSGFPDVRLVISADKLLQVRESDECRVFRDWLRSTDELTDEDVKELVSNLRAKLGILASSASGRCAWTRRKPHELFRGKSSVKGKLGS